MAFFETESTRLKREVSAMSQPEYDKFKEERMAKWQDYSYRSSIFGLNYIVLSPLILLVLPIPALKSWNLLYVLIAFIVLVIYTERKYGSVRGGIRRLGLKFSNYKLNRVRRFGRIRFY